MIRRRDLLVLGGLGAGVSVLLGRLLFQARPSALCQDKLECQERQAQQDLPKSSDPIWPVLKQCHVTLDRASGTYHLDPTPAVEALAGKSMRVTGYVVPLDGSDQTKDFLIGVNTPVCFYHPPGDPNEVIAVDAATSIEWSDRLVTVEGVFTLIRNAQAGVFFKLTDAREV